MYSTVDCMALQLTWRDEPNGANSRSIFGVQIWKGIPSFIRQILGDCIWCWIHLHSKFESQLIIILLDKKTCDSRALSSLSHQGTPNPDESNDDSIRTNIGERQERQHGPSEYALRREANIAQNQQLLVSLGLSEGGSSALLTNIKRKKGEKGERYDFCLFSNAYPTMIWQIFQITNYRW